jgi:hypothetical protein
VAKGKTKPNGEEQPVPTAYLQNLTDPARRALATQRGPIFEEWLRAVRRMNAGITDTDIVCVMRTLLGPHTPEDCFELEERTEKLPDLIHIDGERIDIFETDPMIALGLMIELVSLRQALHKTFGGLDGYRKLRSQYVAEGGKEAEMDMALVKRVRDNRRDAYIRARSSIAPK